MEGVGVSGAQAAKPVTTVHVCVSTFVSVKPLDIFKKTMGQLPAVAVARKN